MVVVVEQVIDFCFKGRVSIQLEINLQQGNSALARPKPARSHLRLLWYTRCLVCGPTLVSILSPSLHDVPT